MIKITNEDNMDLMSRYEDNYFDLAIVDPPYGIGDKMFGGGKIGDKVKMIRSLYDKQMDWDHSVPDESYFIELIRTSKNQIIWGGNYFNLRPTRGIICWDKQQFYPNFSQWEMGWTSFDKPAKLYKISSANPDRIHPTQKPVKLYEWLLMNYAKENDKILDTHLGSGSIAIACHNLGFDLTACEIDKEYYDASLKRLKQHQSQLTLF